MSANNNNNTPVRFPKKSVPKGPNGDILLAAERAKATFNVKDLTRIMYSDEYLRKMETILKILENEPAFDKSDRYHQGRSENFFSGLWKDKRILELIEEHNWDEEDLKIANFLYDMVTPFGLHYDMFIPTLENQASDEQKKLFLEPALKHHIVGCYAQTELGHGSNLRGLETTATYINESNEFEINSPNMTAAKWWIGGLGVAANYAIVIARLITNGKDHGPHPFCVQIRRLEDHKPMRGVIIGDIGPKFGFNSVDNGFIMFDHYCVPHDAFLAKYSQVMTPSGEYIKPPNAKLAYGTMAKVRAHIVLDVCTVIARAATVAVRYSAVRKQFVDASNPRKWENEVMETPILDYTMQQYRLLPAIASAYACYFTGQDMIRLFDINNLEMAKGNFLADVHASSSGLKSITTTMAVSIIEDMRRACGGHGYSMFSGLGMLYQDYLPSTTWEGDNYILTQQTARYLLKTYRNVVSGNAAPSEYNPTVSYLLQYLQNPNAKCPGETPFDFLNQEMIISAFGFRAAYGIAKAAESIDKQGRSWNSMLVEINRISRAHCQYVLVRTFFVSLQNDPRFTKPENVALLQVLRHLACLFALYTIEQELGEFFTSGYLNSDQAAMLKDQVIALLEQIRPNAVALVDAFAFPDYYLHSALGRYDGKVYESYTRMSEGEPLNQRQVVEGYEQFIKPLVHAGLGSEAKSQVSKL
ncbi:acyl-CoA dehydrogenase/oxidase [Phascolomyces articulosus]|uniref:Acyl-coenzyme A oxidase n=1 Tax=Phascolomyces articulosus TaxID=60185 RepID=A0AAD5K697_9FUNG|nr:acyl-CoA dehydrogenase/oxidase [Phascolomyces articulosus]